jgi:hypothetical protein
MVWGKHGEDTQIYTMETLVRRDIMPCYPGEMLRVVEKSSEMCFSVAGPNHRFCEMQIRPELALVQPPQVPALSSMILRPPQPMVLPHISLVGPVYRFPLHSSCKPLIAIGVIAERASVTDSNPAHPVAKAGHNVTT